MKTIFRLFVEWILITGIVVFLSILPIKGAIILGSLITITKIVIDAKKIMKELAKRKIWCKQCKKFIEKRPPFFKQ